MPKRRPGTNKLVRILIADPYPLFRRGLSALLGEQDGFAVVGECGEAKDLMRLCEELAPDIVLLALDLAGFQGGVPVGELLTRSPRSKYVVLAVPGDEESLAACVDSGLAGYVMKSADPPLVVNAIRAVHTGQPWLQRELTGALFQELRKARGHRAGPAGHLTARESEVLRLLAEGLRNTQIAEHLFISERTVKVHISSIFSKLQLRDRVQAARYAIRTGLVRM